TIRENSGTMIGVIQTGGQLAVSSAGGIDQTAGGRIKTDQMATFQTGGGMNNIILMNNNNEFTEVSTPVLGDSSAFAHMIELNNGKSFQLGNMQASTMLNLNTVSGDVS